jgi:hypothetical protein
MKTQNTLQAILAGAILVAPVLAGQGELESKVNEQKPSPSFAGLNITTWMKDSYTAPVGFTVGKGPVNQTMVTLGVNDLFVKGDNLLGFTWADYDFGYEKQGKSALDEQDFGVSYTIPLGKVAGSPLSLNTGYQFWSYWSKNLGDHDNIVDLNLNWAGPVTVDIQGRQIFAHNGTKEGRYLILQLSKPVSLGKVKNWSLTLTPSASTSFNNHFFQDDNSWMGAMFMGRVSASKKDLSVSLGGGYVYSAHSSPIERSHPIWEASVSYTFK